MAVFDVDDALPASVLCELLIEEAVSVALLRYSVTTIGRLTVLLVSASNELVDEAALLYVPASELVFAYRGSKGPAFVLAAPDRMSSRMSRAVSIAEISSILVSPGNDRGISD